jgi:hypothetical protein
VRIILAGFRRPLVPPGIQLGLSRELPIRHLPTMHGDGVGDLRLLRHQPALCLCPPAEGVSLLTLTPQLQMRTPAMLLAQKQQLVERLQQEPGPHERHQIERLLADIDEALNFLDQDDRKRAAAVRSQV